jgi:cell division protein FtsL
VKASFVNLWTAAVFATAAACIVHLTLRFDIIRLGYTLAKERAEQEQLIEQRRLLSLEAATLRQMDRVEAVARGAFGMDVVPASRVIAVRSGAVPRISGRAQ